MSEEDFPKKWEKWFPTGFKDTVEGYSEDDLKKTLVESQQKIAEVEFEMSEDQKLMAIKDELKDLAGAYKDAIKTYEAKARYCAHLLKLRGNA